jgi:hypothetical protein
MSKLLLLCLPLLALPFLSKPTEPLPMEKQLTYAPHGHILTNIGVWSPDSRWIVYDIRSDPAGTVFDGTRIERVHVETGEVQTLYESRQGACCGVATSSPTDERVVFMHGPENPTPDWQYSFCHRRGVIVDAKRPGVGTTLDACGLTPPFTPGALRGGSHVHTFSGDGQWVAFTYEDHLLTELEKQGVAAERNQRNIGVSVPGRAVTVKKDHPRNHDGSHFSVLVTRTVNQPRPGSDEINRACEESWIGTAGYRQATGTWQRRALAFQGSVATPEGKTLAEVFVVDLPEDVTVPSDEGPLAGTATRRPLPPKGTVQRRLTFTADRKYPGIQGPRHWLRTSPDGNRIGFLMKDDAGIVQLWTISPNGGPPVQVTSNPWSIASTFTWSPDGKQVACVIDNSIFLIDMQSRASQRLTPRTPDAQAPRPEACVFAPDGKKLAYVRPVAQENRTYNQVFVCSLPQP